MRAVSLTIGTVVALIIALLVMIVLFFFIPPLFQMANDTTNSSGNLFNLWPF